jgi:hypothetical protein
MKAYEFPVKVTADGHLTLPIDFVRSLPSNQTVRVLILIDEPSDRREDSDWSRLTASQFLADYSDVDALYDEPEP